MASEQFSLCWDNFHKNMSSGMNSLLESEDLVDVTLAVEGKCLKAHKMVLSVCSPYFKELFKSNPCQHPIVFMKDVSYVALSDLLQFMYQGEVQVSQENLTTFIKTAEALQIKGLTGDGNGSADTEPAEPQTPEKQPIHQIEEYKPVPRSKKQPHPASTPQSPSVKRPRLSTSSSDSQMVTPQVAKTEPISSTPSGGNVTDNPVQFKMEPYDQSHSLIDETGDENFGDDNLDDTNVDDTDDYSMMEGGVGEEEPQAGTSTDGAGEGQVMYIPATEYNRRRPKYSKDDLVKAVKQIQDKSISLSKAARIYRIPKSTLHNKVTGNVPSIKRDGSKIILNRTERVRLDKWIIGTANLGFSTRPTEVQEAVQKILEWASPPDDKWVRSFLQRSVTITKINSEIIFKSRALATEMSIREWFSGLTDFLQRNNLLEMMQDSSRIFSIDETGARATNTPLKKEKTITFLCNYSAKGIVAPPMIVFPFEIISKEIAEAFPSEWALGRSSSLGWLDSTTFFEYMSNVFYPWLVKRGTTFPIILFVDGQTFHYSLELYEFFTEKKIIMYSFLPNSCHILQPCDISIFRPFIAQWEEETSKYVEKCNWSVALRKFSESLHEGFEKATKAALIINKFRNCGLFPLDANAVDYSRCESEAN